MDEALKQAKAARKSRSSQSKPLPDWFSSWITAKLNAVDSGPCPICAKRGLKNRLYRPKGEKGEYKTGPDGKEKFVTIPHSQHAAVCAECGYSTSTGIGLVYEPNKTADEIEFTKQATKRDSLKYYRNSSIFAQDVDPDWTFDSFSAVDGEREMDVKKQGYALAKRLVANKKHHAVLAGTVGTGKSHIAIATVHRVLELMDYRQKVMFVSFPELINQVKLGFKRQDVGLKVQDQLKQMAKCGLLVVDDIGAEYDSDYNKEQLNHILQARAGKALIVTTNLGFNELKETYGARSVSRLMIDNPTVINFKGITDHRTGGKF